MLRILSLTAFLALGACNAGSSELELSASAFDSTLQAHSSNAPIVLIDVRTPGEYASGHLKNAQLMDWNSAEFDAKISAIPKDSRILLYCRSGNRSGQALQAMQAMGYSNVQHLDGGIKAWVAEAKPVE